MKRIVALPEYFCFRCKKVWNPRLDKIPTVCPKCKSPYWNIPRKVKEGNEAK